MIHINMRHVTLAIFVTWIIVLMVPTAPAADAYVGRWQPVYEYNFITGKLEMAKSGQDMRLTKNTLYGPGDKVTSYKVVRRYKASLHLDLGDNLTLALSDDTTTDDKFIRGSWIQSGDGNIKAVRLSIMRLMP